MITAEEADSLALQARGGDGPALARLYRAFAPAVLGYLRRATGDPQTAEDLLHDVFLHVMQGRGRYNARGRFRSWLFAVAANAVRDQARRRRSRTRLAEDLTHDAAARSSPPPDGAFLARESACLVEEVLAGLPTEQAEAFHLRVREEFSYREMAAITGDPEGTLRSRVHHVLRRLRDRLADADAHQASARRRENEES